MDQRKLKNTPGARKSKLPSFVLPNSTLVKNHPVMSGCTKFDG